MPQRIRPTYAMGPCTIDLKGLRGITELVSNDFPGALFTARDGIWEVYDEPMDSFIQAISQRAKLDSFLGVAETDVPPRTLVLSFDEHQAQVVFDASPEHQRWFEHFIIDLKKYVGTPTYSQRIAHQRQVSLSLPFLLSLVVTFPAPHTRIVLRDRPRNEFLEAIKANLVSNLIWLVLGSAITLLVGWILSNLR